MNVLESLTFSKYIRFLEKNGITGENLERCKEEYKSYINNREIPISDILKFFLENEEKDKQESKTR